MKEFKNKHIGSYGVILDGGKIALIKKSRGGYKGKLDLPGGGIEHGELPIDALKREMMEELGIEIHNIKLLDVSSVTFKWHLDENTIEDLHHIGIFYTADFKSKDLKTTKDGQDSLGAKWYPITELKKEELSPFAILVLEKLGHSFHKTLRS